MSTNDLMTVREVAEYFKFEERTIYRLVAREGIPAFKVGGSWRFRKCEIYQRTASSTSAPNDTRERPEQEQ